MMENNETTENTNTRQQQYIKSYTGDLDTTNSANETVVDPSSNDQNDDANSTVRFVESETAEHAADQPRLEDQPQFFTAVDLSLNSNSESITNNRTTTSPTVGSAPNTNPSTFSNSHHQPSTVIGLSLNSKLQSNKNDEVVFQPTKTKRKQYVNQFLQNHQPYAAVDLSSNSNLKSMLNDNIVVPHSNRMTSTSNTDQPPQGYYHHRQGSWLYLNDNAQKKKRVNSYFRKSPKFSSTNHMGFKNSNEFQTTVSKFDSERTSDLLKNAGDLDKLNKMTAKDFDNDRYARFGIHEYEIKDYIRTMTYKNCIEHCAENHFKDKVVLVIRSGIGLLPLLCVRDGFAKKVIGLEQSACIEYARRVVDDNMYSNQITLIQSSVQDLKKLPNGLSQVDVILSDFLGECVLGQGDQMEQVIEARDRFLKPNGLMVPMTISLYGHVSEHRKAYENQRLRKNKNKVDEAVVTDYDSDSSTDSTRCSWWSNVYGFDMRSNPTYLVDKKSDNGESEEKWRIMPEPVCSHFNSSRVMSSSGLIKTFDMYKCTIDETRYVQCTDLKLECVIPYATNKGEFVHMLELFMNVEFPNGQDPLANNDDSIKIGFSTSSFSPYTRYKQTGLLLRDQLLVENGDVFVINEFCMQRGLHQNPRKELFDETINCQNTLKKFRYEDNLKLRLRYTFINKYIKAMNRRCAYTVIKYLF